jgi:hypothetical protein
MGSKMTTETVPVPVFDNAEDPAQQAYTNPDLKLAREFKVREQPGPDDDYEGLFGAPPVIKPPTNSRTR